jgi:rRNA maturation endonuclease Nob1
MSITFADKNASAAVGSAERTWRAADANEVKSEFNTLEAAVALNTAKRSYPSGDETKLAGVEAGATADQTATEIKTLFDSLVAQVSGGEITAGTEAAIRQYSPANIKAFIDAHAGGGGDLSQTDIDTLAELNAILTDATLIDTNDSRLSDSRSPTAHTHTASEVTDFASAVAANAAVAANTAKRSYPSGDETKLAGIEANATADQTGAEIKTAYEAEADTNAFTDAEQTKLGNVPADTNTELAAKAALVNVSATVVHGATASTARPTGYASVIWIGSVEPTNATNDDVWFDNTPA